VSATSTRASSTRASSTRDTSTRDTSTRGTGQRTGVHRTAVHRTGALRTGPRSVPVRPELTLVAGARGGAARARATGGRSGRTPFVLLVLALLACTTLALLVLNTAIAVDSLKATTLRQGNTTREQEVQRLQQQVIDGSTPQSVAGDAARAGLVPAGTPGYLVVQPDGTSTLRGTPSPAPAATLPPVPGAATPAPAPAPTAPAAPAPVPAPGGAVPAPAGADQAAGD